MASDFKTGDFVSWNSSGGRAYGRITKIVRDGSINVPDSSFTVNGTEDNPAALIRVYSRVDDGWEPSDRLVGHRFSTLTAIDALKKPTKKRNANFVRAIDNAIKILNDAKASYMEDSDDEMDEEEEENRAQVSLVPPAFMRASARRGLDLLADGESSVSEKGLKQQTVNDARKMASGEALSPEKWRKISPWIARHINDLDAVQGNEITPGLVAMLLWGGGSSKASARRTAAFADGVVEKLDRKE